MTSLSRDAHELSLYIDNVQSLARQRDAVCAALARHVKRGDYDVVKAPVAFMYLAEAAAMAYAKEFGTPATPWHSMFPVAIRAEVAREFAVWFDSCARRSEVWGDLGPKAATILAAPRKTHASTQS